MRNSIRTRLTIAFVALTAGLLLAVGAVLAWQSYITEQQQALALQSELTQRISTQVTSYIQAQESALQLLVQVQGLNDLNTDQQTQLLSSLLSYSGAFDKLTLLNRYGREQAVVSRTEINIQLGNQSTLDEFKVPMSTGQTYYSPVSFDQTTGEPLMTIAVPIVDVRSGAAVGVLDAGIRFRPIWNLLASVPLGKGGSAYIVDAQGRVIAHNNPSIVLRNTLFSVPSQDGIHAGVSGTNVVLAANHITLGQQKFTVVAETPISEAFANIINTELTIGILLLIAMAVAGGLGWVIARQIVRPIESLVVAAQAISAGDLTMPARVESRDEIGALATAFNSMTAQLRDMIGSLEQRVADRTKALVTSAEVSRRLSTILDQQQLVTEVVEQVKSAFNYYHAHIYLRNEITGDLIMAGGTGEAGRIMLANGHKVPKGKGLVGRAVESNTSVLASDTTRDPNWLANPLLPETKSEAAIPISIGDEVLGVLDVQHNIVDGLKPEDMEMLQSIANQAAIAIQNIRSTETIAKRATEFQTVATISTATATIQDGQEMLETVVHLTQRRFGLYHAHVFTYDEDTTLLKIAACGWKEGDEHEGTHGTATIPLQQEQSLVARAARTRQAVIVNDVHADPGWLPNPLLPDTASEMAVPMYVGDQLIGVLDVQSDRSNAFSEEDANVQTTLASQVAVALQNARSFAQTQKQAEREASLNLITQKIQGAATVEAALKTAARELGHALGMKPTLVALDPAALAGDSKGKN